MKAYILTILFLSSHSYAGESSNIEKSDNDETVTEYMEDKSEESYDLTGTYVNTEISEYEKELNNFLVTNDNINIQLSTITFAYATDRKKIKRIKDVLKQAINLNSSKYTIFLANSICHTIDEITPWCHSYHIHEIHYQLDPENVMTYLNNIHKEDNNNKVSKSLSQASDNSKYSHLFLNHSTIQLAEQIDTFNLSDPLLFTQYRNSKDNNMYQFINDLKSRISKSQLKNKGLLNQDIDKAINETLPIITAIGISMTQAIPPAETLVSYCQNTIDNKDCIKVAEILITDESLINQGVASRIFNTLQELQSQKYKKLMCYLQPEDVQIALLVNKNLALQYLKDSKQFSEVEAARKMAYTVYKVEKQHGYNPDFNPSNC